MIAVAVGLGVGLGLAFGLAYWSRDAVILRARRRDDRRVRRAHDRALRARDLADDLERRG